MNHDTDKIDQTVLALLTLTLHDALDRLYAKGWISNPASKAKSVVLTPEAITESRRLFDQIFGKPE